MRSTDPAPPARQRGWVGLVVILVALVIVAFLAKDALKEYGLASGAAATTKAGTPANARARRVPAASRRSTSARRRRRRRRRSNGRAASRTWSSSRPTSARRASTARPGDRSDAWRMIATRCRHADRTRAMNNDYPHPIIAREGWPFLALALAVAVALSCGRPVAARGARVARGAVHRPVLPRSAARRPARARMPCSRRPTAGSSASRRRAIRISTATRSRSACS